MRHITQQQQNFLEYWLRRLAEESQQEIAAGQSPHLVPEEVVGYVERSLPMEHRTVLIKHLWGCLECGERVDAALKERMWPVTITLNGAGPVRAMIAGQTWTRAAMGKGRIEGHGRNGGLETSSTGVIARRRQGDVEVVLHAEAVPPDHRPQDHRLRTTDHGPRTTDHRPPSTVHRQRTIETGIEGESGGLSLTVYLLTAEGRRPISGAAIRVEREEEEGLERVRVGEWTTDPAGRAQFGLRPGEYALALPTTPPLSVLLSLLTEEEGRVTSDE